MRVTQAPSPAEPNRLIAEIGRAVYDFFVFNPSP